MDREILFKAKHEHVVVANKDLEGQWVEGLLWDEEQRPGMRNAN